MMNLSTFKFDGYKITRSLIEINEGFNIDPDKIEMAIKVSGIVNSSDHQFKLHLNLKLKDGENQFKTEIDTIGNYSFKPAEEGKDNTGFFYINASAILFPYIRAYISLLTSTSTGQALNLPTLNLTHLGKELKENITIE